ncbi:uncharacterized protein [Eurosta solidaginis]|uniref:uncharacterized protein n=1 Tax=Eurosta solidaginis TaxID=178769 RepID=UPI003530C09D
MDVIIDHILQFLQFDLAKMFGKDRDCCLCCITVSTPSLTESEDRRISNVYSPRPQILNGDEMMQYSNDLDDCDENQLAEFCEELERAEAEEEAETTERESERCSQSNQLQEKLNECQQRSHRQTFLDSLKNECAEQVCEDKRAGGDVCTCDAVCKRVVSKIAEKCSSSTLLELKCIEERANKLWETLNMHIRNNPCGKFPNWWELKTWQKLPFYWAALSNEILCEDPFENFKRFYQGDKKSTKRGAKRQLERTLILWHRLTPKQRLPFIMEAFISKVGAGKVNISDEHEIQRIICELHNK